MRVRVLLFASLAERAGWREKELELPESATVADLLAELRRGPLLGLPAGSRLLQAVNQRQVGLDQVLQPSDEVALFPPVSGGSDAPAEGSATCTLTREPLDPRALAGRIRGPDCGAVLTFEGTVRDRNGGLPVTGIDYDCYLEMALRVLEALRQEVEQRFPGVRVALAHRIGALEAGATSVLVACAAPHRREAFAACRLAMDRIKETLPIWKNERLADGTSRWL